MAEGVWRTISGRRVFIKKGQSLTEAMKESGKFKNSNKDNSKSDKKTSKINDLKRKINEFEEKHEGLRGRDRILNRKEITELEKELGELDGSTEEARIKKLENHDITLNQEAILRNMGVVGKPSVDEIEMAITYEDSVNNYSGSMYKQIRDQNNKSQNVVELRENIEEFIKISPKYEKETYRGLSFSDDESYNDFIKSLDKGAKIEMNGISSWTSSKKVAEEFANQSKHKVMLVNRTVKEGVSIKNISKWKGEEEVLFGSSTDFKYVDKYMGDNGMVYIYV